MLLLALSCARPTVATPPPTPAPAPPPLPAWAGAVLGDLDTTADACTDFYQYACGGWMGRTPLPADKPSWTRSFSVIREQNLEVMKATLEAAAAAPDSKDADWKRVGTLYGACVDEKAAEAAGTAPLAPLMAEVDKVRDLKSFMRVAGAVHVAGGSPIVQMGVDGDYKDPSRSILYITEGGLGLPDRDYYLDQGAEGKELLGAYEAHIATILRMVGDEAPEASARAVLALETRLAQAWVPRAELRDPDKTYHKLDRVGLQKLTPKLDWSAFLAGAGGPDVVDISVEPPDVLKAFEAIFKKADVASLRAYLRWHAANAMADQLTQAMFDADFAFFGTRVLGTKQPEPRWKRCAKATDGAVGEIAGRYWVEQRFAGESKDVALTMIRNVEGAFEAGLPKLVWMDDPTRAAASGKVHKILNKIGYPDTWRDYSALSFTPGQHGANILAARRFEHLRQVAKVGRSVDRAEWLMTPAMVNAYYNATINEMVFPAGILQPPFFSKEFPSAMNYGAMGMVMGHELTHGFDDSGRKFDADGRLSEWWTPEVATRYEERAACVKEQFDAYPVGDIHVKGDLTLGENIADLGGIRVAYRAWQAQRPSAPSLPTGLTDDQLFFVAYAQGWCTVASPEWQKMLVVSDTHSPPRYRVNGPLSNLPEFQQAFGCADGKAMKRAPACEVW
jgi:endothelin-converting enzyme/putative endopeptidase